jgi:hypothetical protein
MDDTEGSHGRASVLRAGRHVGGEDVVGVAVEVLAGAVVARRRSWSAWRAAICTSMVAPSLAIYLEWWLDGRIVV